MTHFESHPAQIPPLGGFRDALKAIEHEKEGILGEIGEAECCAEATSKKYQKCKKQDFGKTFFSSRTNPAFLVLSRGGSIPVSGTKLPYHTVS